MFGGGDDLLVQHDGETVIDIGRGRFAKLARAGAVKAEIHHRLVGLLAVALAGVGQAVARHHDAALQDQTCSLPGIQERHFLIFRRNDGGIGIGGFVHQPEGHLGGLAQKLDQALGIAETGYLHQDTVIALAFDGHLMGAHLINAAAHHFDRLLHQLLLALGLVGIGHAHDDHATTRLRDVIFLAAHRQDRGTRGRVEAIDQLARLGGAGRIGQVYLHCVVLGLRSVENMRLAEGGANIADHRIGLVLGAPAADRLPATDKSRPANPGPDLPCHAAASRENATGCGAAARWAARPAAPPQGSGR